MTGAIIVTQGYGKGVALEQLISSSFARYFVNESVEPGSVIISENRRLRRAAIKGPARRPKSIFPEVQEEIMQAAFNQPPPLGKWLVL